jgi:PASTA domain
MGIMRDRSRESPFGAFASAAVLIALMAAAPVTASTSARPQDLPRALHLRAGQVNYLADVSDNDNRLLAESGADFRKHFAPPARCRVPAVKGKPLAVAVRAILKRHCSVGTIRRAFSKVVKKDHVISQMPGPRTLLPNQGKVNLVLSRGRKP